MAYFPDISSAVQSSPRQWPGVDFTGYQGAVDTDDGFLQRAARAKRAMQPAPAAGGELAKALGAGTQMAGDTIVSRQNFTPTPGGGPQLISLETSSPFRPDVFTRELSGQLAPTPEQKAMGLEAFLKSRDSLMESGDRRAATGIAQQQAEIQRAAEDRLRRRDEFAFGPGMRSEFLREFYTRTPQATPQQAEAALSRHMRILGAGGNSPGALRQTIEGGGPDNPISDDVREIIAGAPGTKPVANQVLQQLMQKKGTEFVRQNMDRLRPLFMDQFGESGLEAALSSMPGFGQGVTRNEFVKQLLNKPRPAERPPLTLPTTADRWSYTPML